MSTKKKSIRVDLRSGETLEDFMMRLKTAQIFENGYSKYKFEIELDYGDCYYPGDSPGISATIIPIESI